MSLTDLETGGECDIDGIPLTMGWSLDYPSGDDIIYSTLADGFEGVGDYRTGLEVSEGDYIRLKLYYASCYAAGDATAVQFEVTYTSGTAVDEGQFSQPQFLSAPTSESI